MNNEIIVKVKEVKEEIVKRFGIAVQGQYHKTYNIMTDVVCPSFRLKEGSSCKACKLRFKCYTQAEIFIDYNILNPQDTETPLNEKVKYWVKGHGADLDLDKEKGICDNKVE
jgi:hypothetical protein